MRIIIIIGLLWVSACSHVPQQNQHYHLLATASSAMAELMRGHIHTLQTLDTEARQTKQALSFVRETGKLQVPESLLGTSFEARLQFLDNLENAVRAMSFDEVLSPPETQRLNRLAQTLHANSHGQQINQARLESEELIQNALRLLVADWQSKAMQSFAKDIVASLNNDEEKLLLLSKTDKNTSLLKLHQQTLQHLQKQKQRMQFLQNWQALGVLAEKMQQAYLSLVMNKNNNDLQSFYEMALGMQTESLIHAP